MLGWAWMSVVALITSIGSTLGYLGVKQEKPLVGWWEGLSPLWGAVVPVAVVVVVLFLIAVHKQFEEIELERDGLEEDNAELRKQIATLENTGTSGRLPKRGIVMEGGSWSSKNDILRDTLDEAARTKNTEISTEGTVFGKPSEEDDDKERS